MTAEEKIDKLTIECHGSFAKYAATNLKIQTEEGELIPFVFNEVQEILDELDDYILSRGRLVRQYILKARREGVSTRTTGKFFWRTSLNRNKYAVIVTHEPDATAFLFDMQKRYLNNSQREFKPQTIRNNVKKLQFNTPTGDGLDSAITVGTAGKGDFGSGQLIHYLHLSEQAKWPAGTEKSLLTSLLQCVPSEPDTAVIHESTAKGMGGEFYKGFYAARYRIEVYLDKAGKIQWRETINEDADPMNAYVAIFFPWFVFKKYRMEVPKDFKRTEEEEKWVKTYNISDEQLVWYRWALANKCSGDKNQRSQEYPFNAKEAFISSGTPSFDIAQMIEYQQKCPAPIARYECLLTSGLFTARPDGRIQVWEESRPATPYVISADVSEGLVHGDFDSASVWNHATGAQAAHFHGHLTPFEFAHLLFWLGKRYNMAWIVPERNNHGIAVVDKLRELEYPWIYRERIEDPPNKPRNRFGWLTNQKTRPLILDGLKLVLSTPLHGIKCREFFDEAMNFKRQDDGKEEADEGTFDDRVIEAAIGKWTLKKLPPVSVVVQQGVDLATKAGKKSADPGELAYR